MKINATYFCKDENSGQVFSFKQETVDEIIFTMSSRTIEFKGQSKSPWQGFAVELCKMSLIIVFRFIQFWHFPEVFQKMNEQTIDSLLKSVIQNKLGNSFDLYSTRNSNGENCANG